MCRRLDGELIESEVPTGKWAWRHPRGDGAVQYVPLVGNIIFDDVDFGYHENKQILYNIKLYAEWSEGGILSVLQVQEKPQLPI